MDVSLALAYSAVALQFPVHFISETFHCQMPFLWVLALSCAAAVSPFSNHATFFRELNILAQLSDLCFWAAQNFCVPVICVVLIFCVLTSQSKNPKLVCYEEISVNDY